MTDPMANNPSPTTEGLKPMVSDEMIEAGLHDLRDRKLLKYLFDPEPEHCGPYGYVEEPLDLDVQREVVAAIISAALSRTTPTPASMVTEEEIARVALNQIELARTHLVQPVNGSFDYFYVSFAGQRIEFRLNEDRDSCRGPYGEEIAALSAKAAECATAINDLLFDLAKKSARAAILAMSSMTSGVVEAVEQLREPLYRLLLSATSVDQELRNQVDDAFKALDAAVAP